MTPSAENTPQGDTPFANLESSRRRFIKRTSGATIAIVLADLVPGVAFAEDTTCNNRDTNGNLDTDGACGSSSDGFPHGFDPDGSCGQLLNNQTGAGTHLYDPDDDCQHTVEKDSTCGKRTGSGVTYDRDETCGKQTTLQSFDNEDEACTLGSTKRQGNDKDDYCGTLDGGFHDEDQLCNNDPSDEDQSCEKDIAAGVTDSDEDNLSEP